MYATYIRCIISYTVWIHLKSWGTCSVLPHRNNLVLSIYCLSSTVKLHHLDSTILRGAGVFPLSLFDQIFLILALLYATWWRGALVDMYARMNLCVCVHTSVCAGWLPPLSSSVIWHPPDTFWESHDIHTHVELCSGCEPGMRSRHVTSACPIHLWRNNNPFPCNSALQMSFYLRRAHTPSQARCRLWYAELQCSAYTPGAEMWSSLCIFQSLTNKHDFPNSWKVTGRTGHYVQGCVGPGLHSERSDVRSLAYVEEFERLPPQSGDPLCLEFGCVRLYSTNRKVCYVMDTGMAYLRTGTHNVQSSAPSLTGHCQVH